MRIDVVMLSDAEAEVHYRPGWLGRVAGARHTYSPLIRLSTCEEASHVCSNAGRIGVMCVLHRPRWVHKLTGRDAELAVVRLLERLTACDTVKRQLLLAAADEVEE